MLTKKWIIFFTVALFLQISHAKGKTILVRTQADFDALNENLLSSLKNSTDDNLLVVKFSAGTFVAKDKHVMLGWKSYPNVMLRFVGNNTIIIPDGKAFFDGDKYDGVFSVNNSWMSGKKDCRIWSGVRYAEGLVEVLDASTKSCRLNSKDLLHDNNNCDNIYILIPEWCQSGVYKVTKIEKGYIYFTADNLAISYNGGYIVNDDYNYAQKPIRYKLCNVELGEDNLTIIGGKVRLPKGMKSVRESEVHTFFHFQSSQFKSIDISGFKFLGNSYRDSHPAIFVCDTKSGSFTIRNCEFTGMHGTVVGIESSPYVKVVDNSFYDCYHYGVSSDNKSANTIIHRNKFDRMGLGMQCSMSVACKGENYYIADNTFVDFGYSGIGVGVWNGTAMQEPSSGIVEKNVLTFTSDYAVNAENNCIMDGGAIYVWTQNTKVVIRNNYISGYTGVADNRGIFCDDGAFNMEIYENVITNIPNSYCIDSRRVKSVESRVGSVNINNKIYDNVVDGRIRFQGNERKDNGCFLGTTYRVSYEGKPEGKDLLSNINDGYVEESIDGAIPVNDKVLISRNGYEKVKQFVGCKTARKFFTRR